MTDHRRVRRFVSFVIAYATSTGGNFLNLIALNLYVYHLTDSAVQTGMLMALRLSVGFLVGPVAGVLATRCDRRTVMVASDVAQALAMVTLVALPVSHHLHALYAVAVVMGASSTVFSVALRSSVPEMVGANERVRANGYLVTGKSFGMVAGFASAGMIVGWFGFTPAFLINAASFVVSALVLVWLPLPFRAADQRPEGRPGSQEGREGREGQEAAGTGPSRDADERPLRALRVLWASSGVLLAMVALRGLDAFGSASHNVALPVFADVANPENPAAFLSQFWVCWAVGCLTASQVAPRWVRRTGRPLGERAFAVAASLMSAAFVMVFAGLPTPLLILVALAAGLADGATEIIYTSRLQAVDDNLRGSVFGLSASAETLGFAVGMLASSMVLEQWPALVAVGLFHGVVVLGVVGFLLSLRRFAVADRTGAVSPAAPRPDPARAPRPIPARRNTR